MGLKLDPAKLRQFDRIEYRCLLLRSGRQHKDIAAALGLTDSNLSHHLSRHEGTRLDLIEKIAALLNVPVETLVCKHPPAQVAPGLALASEAA